MWFYTVFQLLSQKYILVIRSCGQKKSWKLLIILNLASTFNFVQRSQTFFLHNSWSDSSPSCTLHFPWVLTVTFSHLPQLCCKDITDLGGGDGAQPLSRHIKLQSSLTVEMVLLFFHSSFQRLLAHHCCPTSRSIPSCFLHNYVCRINIWVQRQVWKITSKLNKRSLQLLSDKNFPCSEQFFFSF